MHYLLVFSQKEMIERSNDPMSESEVKERITMILNLQQALYQGNDVEQRGDVLMLSIDAITYMSFYFS